MIGFSSINKIESTLRQHLIAQSQLDGKYVLNSLSVYGTELDELLEEDIYKSIDKSDSLILFELRSRDNKSDVSMMNEEDSLVESIEYDKAFTLYLIIYGSNSSDLALKLVSRFRTEKVRGELYDNGIYLEKVSDPTIINEYKNNTMWLRNDISIDVSVKYIVSTISSDTDFQKINYTIIEEDD